MTDARAYPKPDGGTDEAAAFWDARLRNPDCAAAERAAFEAWRAGDPANAAAFEKLQQALDALRAAAARPELRAMRDAALRTRRTPRAAWVTGLAAALLLAISAAWSALPQETKWNVIAALGFSEPQSTGGQPALAAKTFATAIGGRSTITLDDGSRVTLNTQSRIETHFSKTRRDVTLVAGQALFEVAHDATRPFVVTAGDRQVTAIGTAFDVRLEPTGVRVVLVEGRVAVDERADGPIAALLGTERRELVAGQEYVSKARAANIVRAADVNEAILWRDGRVAFNDVPLTQAIAEMNRYATGALVVADPSMARLRVNGVFRTGETRAFVNALEEYFPIRAEQQPGGDTLLVWRR
jgi:transmembrane sensor